jgi:hypothetical protein
MTLHLWHHATEGGQARTFCGRLVEASHAVFADSPAVCPRCRAAYQARLRQIPVLAPGAAPEGAQE